MHGCVAVLKLNPVNEYNGPALERAMAPLVERGVLKFVYGGGPVRDDHCHPNAARVQAGTQVQTREGDAATDLTWQPSLHPIHLSPRALAQSLHSVLIPFADAASLSPVV